MPEAKNQVYPRIVYRSPDLEEGRFTVDWAIADAKLLSGPDIPRSRLKSEAICDIKESSKAGLYNDEVAGLKMVPIQDITQALYEDPDRLNRLRSVLGITVNKTVDELFEDGWFKDAKGGASASED